MRKAMLIVVVGVLSTGLLFGCSKSEKKNQTASQANPKQTVEETAQTHSANQVRQAVQQAMQQSRYPQAPDFELVDLNGKPVRLSDYKGKMIILDFWATWCPPCRAEIPSFVKLYSEYKDKGLVIIGVSLDREGPDVVREFAKNFKMNYPVVMGDMKTVSAYGGIEAIPTTFIINKKGQIVDRFVGYRDENTFRNEIARWLLNES